jgi:two-component system, NarL family, nitrate/nitrite response regulator NarL
VTERSEALKENSALAPIRILIVDEQNVFRDGIANLLAAQPDMDVVGCAEAAEDALTMLKELQPDICLLGWPATSQNSMKAFSTIQDGKLQTRVIMLVNEEVKEDFFETVRQGCCGIVPKQTSTELLIKSIRKVHAGEFWLDRKSTAQVIRRLTKRSSGAPLNQGTRQGLREHGGALSAREREIVALVAQGFKNKEMAERMFISEQTVKNHLHNIFDKLGVSDRLELALYAIHHNLHDSQ